MATTFHTAIFTREGTLGLTIAECESSRTKRAERVRVAAARDVADAKTGNPGVVVRFEGHVNATCGLECRGATGKPCKAARKVGSDMCARCPGGAYGLSKARAEAIKSFVAKCGVDVDRVYAVGFAGTRRLSDDITEEKGAVNRRVEVHMMPYIPGRL